MNQKNEVVRYNLAFIHHLTCRVDNGRVLGYDNAHDMHERHWMGTVEPVAYTSYEETLLRFQAEVDEIRRTA